MKKNEILNAIMLMSDEERLMLIGDIKKNKLDKPKRISKREYAYRKCDEIGCDIGYEARKNMLELADIVTGNYHKSNTEVGIQRNVALPTDEEKMQIFNDFITDFVGLMEKYSVGKNTDNELVYEYHNVLKEAHANQEEFTVDEGEVIVE